MPADTAAATKATWSCVVETTGQSEPKMADGSSARHALFPRLFLLFGRSEVFCKTMTLHVSERQVLPSIVFAGVCLQKENLRLDSFRRHIARTCACFLSVCSVLFVTKGSALSSYRSHLLSHGVE